VRIDPAVFRAWCKAEGLPAPTPEYRIVPGRRFRWEWAWPEHEVALEIQGGVWIGGKHGRGSGVVKDHEKMNLAVLAGWRVLQVQPKHLMTTETRDWLRQLLRLK